MLDVSEGRIVIKDYRNKNAEIISMGDRIGITINSEYVYVGESDISELVTALVNFMNTGYFNVEG